MRTRAEIDTEPRTVQFLVERHPPHARWKRSAEGAAIAEKNAQLQKFPFVIEVFYPPEPITSFNCATCVEVYKMVPAMAKSFIEKGLQPTMLGKPATLADGHVCVCECMGRIIE